MELSKNVEIAGITYQIGRFRARDGSWILMQILTKMLPSVFERAFTKGTGATLAAGRAALSEDEFANIQGHCLSVCRRLETGGLPDPNGLPMPVFVLPGTWAIKELEYDLSVVMGLTIQALLFNLTGFFQGGGLRQMSAMLPDLDPNSNSPDTQT